ncbi:Phosphatidyl-N-methylethanolamine N-methyltransferase [Borealophlyctis nickersoniae]|nr:Phosphatidyl-N-methylethanolamine N-methyltransferase [Borealophlyctis nickersoniae]
MNDQPSSPLFDHPIVRLAAIALFGVGNIFVLTSMYKLGVTGTYLGDYFGILMDARVTGFPFNVMENPMYSGSTMCFLASALWSGSPAGLVLTGVVHIVYYVAVNYFEGPFTTMIYTNRDKARKSR